MTPAARLLVFRALQLGDVLCAVPALRALRAAHPDAEIAFVGLPGQRDLVDRYPRLVDTFLAFPGFPGLPEQEPDLAALPPFLADVQGRRFDLALQLHGDGSITNTVVSLLGARELAGYRPAGAAFVPPGRFMPYPDFGPESLRHLQLLAWLGYDARDARLDFPVSAADERELDALAPGLRARRYAVVHPGARSPSRRWAAEGFRVLACEVARAGLLPVITGSADEVELAQSVAAGVEGESLVLAGRTSLGSLAALVGGACVTVTNDTGVSHLAAALGAPSVVLFTGSDPSRWAPLDARRHRPVVAHGANGGAPGDVRDASIAAAQAALAAALPPRGRVAPPCWPATPVLVPAGAAA